MNYSWMPARRTSLIVRTGGGKDSTPGRGLAHLIGPDRGIGDPQNASLPVVSPDEMNRHLRTVIVAPLTTVERPYPTRISVTFQGKSGQVAVDPLRTVDRQRLMRKLGAIRTSTAEAVSTVLVEMFTRE